MTYDPYDLYGLSINTYIYIYIDGSHPASEVYLTRSRGAIGYLAPTAPMEFMAGAFGWSLWLEPGAKRAAECCS